ncbi:septum site-determining protein MinC [Comamonas serinivorans]|uniref:Probable septum site-determining protein MinC n=2 Tax=Comamonas serinivorans TaxID=1082851 RepID=A0A1Y0EUA1_9BURK|nr:septum site-determining protein MinC [Comamonas serinivorans]
MRTTDLDAMLRALEKQFAEQPDFFDQDPVLIDLTGLPPELWDHPIDFVRLVRALQGLRMLPVAVRGGSLQHQQDAFEAGLVPTHESVLARQPVVAPTPAPVPVAPPPPAVQVPPGAMVIDRPLRSGQQVYARGTDLVVLAMVNNGAEVAADGHIHVYAPLRGKAIAGARGRTDARIFAMSMEPELISICGVYRTSEAWPADVQGRAAQVHLESGPEGDKLVITPIKLG